MQCTLKEARELYNRQNPKNKLTQEGLAKRVGTTQPTIARIESGESEPGAFLLKRIAEALGLRRMDILINSGCRES